FVDASPDDPETNMLKVYQGGLGLPEKAYYEDESYEEVRGQYRDYIAQIFTLAGFSEEADRAQSVFNFERALAKAHWPIAECRDVAKTHNLLPASQLKELAPDFDWDQWWEASGIAPTT
ncbi:M13 family metallopeptidase N-terminal domain-containing protein, partial [Aerococcus urinae]|nr:M13 family metallopeptidase N-terminal domain-containing protein [Aerococcus urinae]